MYYIERFDGRPKIGVFGSQGLKIRDFGHFWHKCLKITDFKNGKGMSRVSTGRGKTGGNRGPGHRGPGFGAPIFPRFPPVLDTIVETATLEHMYVKMIDTIV